MIPITAVTVLAIVFASIWLRSRWEQRSTHLAMQQELMRLNTPSMLRDVSSYIAVTPGTVRSAGAENELTVPANVEWVALGLVWTQRERFPTYQATIRKIDEDESFTIPNLQLDSGNIIRLRLPSRLLTRGLYRIEASGIDAGGGTGPADEYQFQVNK